MTRFTQFLAHNNLIPIALGLVILGTGSVYASQNPERIYAVESRVVAIDNTYLVDLNLDAYTPTVEIIDVREDADAFYVTYDLSTIALVDSVWQDTIKTRTLTVHKDTLADYRDLGAFVTTQLRQVIERELTHLRRVQVYEQRQVSQKQIAMTHRGLIGMFMDDKTETLPPYTKEEVPEPVPAPRIVEQPERTPPTQNEPDTSQPPIPAPVPEADTTSSKPDSSPSEGSGIATNQPHVSLLGSSTIQVAVGDTYKDMGVVIHDIPNTTSELQTFLDGTMVETIVLDTATTSTHTVRYVLLVTGVVVDEVERQVQIVAKDSDTVKEEPKDESEIVVEPIEEVNEEEEKSPKDDVIDTDDIEEVENEVGSDEVLDDVVVESGEAEEEYGVLEDAESVQEDAGATNDMRGSGVEEDGGGE